MQPADNHLPSRPAVFWDRDGTLIEDRGHLAEVSEVVFFPETIAAMKRLGDAYAFFIVTNQCGVAKGLIDLQDVERVNRCVASRLAEAGIEIVETYVCPHQPGDGCDCIKPNPRFLLQAAEVHAIDLRRSFVVGDHPHDVELARRAGAKGIYVCTGHGEKHRAALPVGEIVVPDIATAVEWILQHPARS